LWKKLSDHIPYWKKIRKISQKFSDPIPDAISTVFKNSFRYTTSFNSSSLYDKGKSRSLTAHFQLTPLQEKYFEIILARHTAKNPTLLQRLPSIVNEIAARAAARDMYCSRPGKNGTPVLKNKPSLREKFSKTDEIELPLVIIQDHQLFDYEMNYLTTETPEDQSPEEEY
jgi:hypothetical protein